MRRENRAHPNEVEVREMRVPQGHLEAREFFLAPPPALGQKALGRDEHAWVDQPQLPPSPYHAAAASSTGGSLSPPRSTVACITCTSTSAGLSAPPPTSTFDWPRSLPRTLGLDFARETPNRRSPAPP